MRIVIATQGLPFDGDTLKNQSLGGSETAVICLARELYKLGNDVTVYNNCKNEGFYDGVEYLNVNKFIDFVHVGYADICIISRFMQMFEHKLNTKLNILWNHDILTSDFKTILYSVTWNIDYMYCLSDYHKKQYLKELPELKPIIKLNTNGLDSKIIPNRKDKKHKIMFTSRPERGLYKALEIYEKLKDKKLELLICNYTSIMTKEVEHIEKLCANKVMQLVNNGYNITFGSFNKKELYKHISESKAVIYPAKFPEISCISAMEAQACGTVYICTHDFALKETMGYKGITINKDYDINFLKRLKDIIDDNKLRADVEKIGLSHIQKYTWENVAKKFIEDAEKHFKERSKDVDGIIDRLMYESDLVIAREIAKKESPKRVKELNHILRFADGKDDYKNIYEDESTHERIDLPFEQFDRAGRFVWISEKVKEYNYKKVLDFACHMGASTIKISNDNSKCKVIGYDLSETAINKAIQRKELYSKNKDNVSFVYTQPVDKYDALFNGEMLEHVLNPESMIDGLEAFVNEGGKMFITVPKGAWEWLSRKENKIKDVVYHINEFDAQDIEDMFGKKKDLKVLVLHNAMRGAYGEFYGNYMVEYTVDGTPTGKRDFKRKRLTTRPHQSISLCMIGKNAEKTIEQTFDSLKDTHGNMIPDEIILADDFSTDDMCIRAKKYDVKIKKLPYSITQPDLWGFANARNFSIEDAKSKWILWIDTDEIVKGFEFARKYLECPFQNAYVMKQYHPQRDNYIPCDTPQRLFKKGTGTFYGYIHEQAQSDINNDIKPALILIESEIWNMGSALEHERRNKAMNRNLPLLDKDWKENVIKKQKNNEEIRKLTPILVIRDLLNRMQQVYGKYGTYETREVKERILPYIMKLYIKYCKDETSEIYISIADKIMQQVYEALKLGHDIDLIIDGKQIKKRYVSIDDLVKDIKKA